MEDGAIVMKKNGLIDNIIKDTNIENTNGQITPETCILGQDPEG